MERRFFTKSCIASMQYAIVYDFFVCFFSNEVVVGFKVIDYFKMY